MNRYEAYPEYKDSSVGWVGQVPTHWQVMAIKWLTPVCRGASPRPIDDPKYFDDSGKYGWVRISDVTSSDRYLLETEQKLSDYGSSFSVRLPIGSLFLSIAGSVGKPCITGIEACIHDGFVYFPLLKIEPMWLYWIFEAKAPFVGLGKLNTQLNLNTETVGGIKISLPPRPERAKILKWLDIQTARIDTLIAKKTRFIELLKEKRQAVITKAVTKGLDDSVEMKDSGVEWLGRVPKNWRVTQLGYLTTKIGSGKTPSGGAAVYVNQGVLFLRSQNVYDDGLRLDDVVHITEETHKEMANSAVAPNDVLLNITGGSIGRSSLVPDEFPGANVNQHVCIIRCSNKNLAEFVYFFFCSHAAKGQIDSFQTGAGREGLNFEQLANFKLVLPPSQKMTQITSAIREAIYRLDALMEKTQRSIELLKEKRSALITAAVTGKIDVREAA